MKKTIGDISYELRLRECGLTTLEIMRQTGDEIQGFTILNGYDNINRRLEDMNLH